MMGRGSPTVEKIYIIVAAIREESGFRVAARDLFDVEPPAAEEASGAFSSLLTLVGLVAHGGNTSVPIFSGGYTSPLWRVFVPDDRGPSVVDSFEKLYREHGVLLRKIATRRYNVPPEDAEALVHDSFILYMQRHTIVRDPKAWLVTAVSNECKHYWRDRKREEPLLPEHGETAELGAVLVEGSCLSLRNEHAMAIGAFDRVIALSRRRGDLTLLARAVNNMAASYRALGDFDRATACYSEAIGLYEEAGMATEETRARWGLAATLVARGELSAGIEALEVVRTELAGRGLTNDAALATLGWAEARLAAGAPAGVAAVCARIVMTFESERMERNARVALAYLHEALAAGTATPGILRHVRAYLEELPAAPERLFTPPA